MLILAKSLGELRFGELAAVYSDAIQASSAQWSRYPRGLALEMAEQDFRQYLREVFFPTPGTLCAIWEVDGKYVSALRLEPYRDGFLVTGLETAPEQRRKGYGGALLQALLESLADQGPVKVYSHVHKRNIASRKTHEKCGFREISDCAVYLNGSVDFRCATLLYE